MIDRIIAPQVDDAEQLATDRHAGGSLIYAATPNSRANSSMSLSALIGREKDRSIPGALTPNP